MMPAALIAAAEGRIAREGVPEVGTFSGDRVIIGWVDGAIRWAPAGDWIELCEAVDRATRLRDGEDLDHFADLDGLRIPVAQFQAALQEQFDSDVQDLARKLIGPLTKVP